MAILIEMGLNSVKKIEQQREESAAVYTESCDGIDAAVENLRGLVDPATLAEITAATASIRVAALENTEDEV